MYDVGRICMKIAGRDAGKLCVVINKVDDLFVMIDGQTRRRKCNIRHLEPLDKTVDLNQNASESEIKEVFKKLGIELIDKKSRKPTERKKKQHIKKIKPVKEKKSVDKKVIKKTTSKKEVKKNEDITEAKVVDKKEVKKSTVKKTIEKSTETKSSDKSK